MVSSKRPLKAVAATFAHLDELLDEALQQTFPASDPVAIHVDPIERAIGTTNRVNGPPPLYGTEAKAS
jgi:hypothetical protein